MAVENAPADAVFPKTDLWTFLFQRPDRSFPDSQGTVTSTPLHLSSPFRTAVANPQARNGKGPD